MSLSLCEIWCKGWMKMVCWKMMLTMGSIGGYISKTTSIKCAVERVTVETVCVIPKTEPVHSAIHLPHTSL